MIAEVQQLRQVSRRSSDLSLAVCLAVLLCGSVARAQSVAFINPGKSDEIYWVTAAQGMQAAAHSLGMTFEVQYAEREPLKTLEIAREMVARPAGQAAQIYRGHRRLFRGRSAAGDHRSCRREEFSRLQLDPRRAARRDRIAARQIQRLAWLAGAAGGRRRLSDGARAHRARQKRKSIQARRQASHAGDCRRSLHAVIDQSQSGHAPRGRRGCGGRRRGGGLRGVDARERRPASRVALPALSRRQARLGGQRSDGVRRDGGPGKRGGKPGVDAWFSGINTSSEALEAVKSGRLTSLAGGHFITGAWAL